MKNWHNCTKAQTDELGSRGSFTLRICEKFVQISREVVYLNTRQPHQRFKLLKPLSEILELNDNSTHIFLNNIVDYYHARPIHMQNISLFYFVSWYRRGTPPPISGRGSERVFIAKYNTGCRKESKRLLCVSQNLQ